MYSIHALMYETLIFQSKPLTIYILYLSNFLEIILIIFLKFFLLKDSVHFYRIIEKVFTLFSPNIHYLCGNDT